MPSCHWISSGTSGASAISVLWVGRSAQGGHDDLVLLEIDAQGAVGIDPPAVLAGARIVGEHHGRDGPALARQVLDRDGLAGDPFPGPQVELAALLVVAAELGAAG